MYPYASYQQVQVLESAPEDIMLQLYQGALVRIKQAQELWSKDEKDAARQKRLQAMDIICYLDETLDRDDESGLVDELEALYAFMVRELTTSTRHDDFERLDVVYDVLKSLYAGWKEAVAAYKEEQKHGAHVNGQEKVASVG